MAGESWHSLQLRVGMGDSNLIQSEAGGEVGQSYWKCKYACSGYL